jgi:hypothetical protein
MSASKSGSSGNNFCDDDPCEELLLDANKRREPLLRGVSATDVSFSALLILRRGVRVKRADDRRPPGDRPTEVLLLVLRAGDLLFRPGDCPARPGDLLGVLGNDSINVMSECWTGFSNVMMRLMYLMRASHVGWTLVLSSADRRT